MSRRRAAEKNEILPDPKYGNKTLAKFINVVMSHGKKSVAEKIVYGALDEIDNKLKKNNSIELFTKALDNVKPIVEVKSRRIGGATYQIPVEIKFDRSQTLAIRWIIGAAKKRSEKNMKMRLAAELLDAADKRGTAIRKSEDTYRMAEANKAFSHYRW